MVWHTAEADGWRWNLHLRDGLAGPLGLASVDVAGRSQLVLGLPGWLAASCWAGGIFPTPACLKSSSARNRGLFASANTAASTNRNQSIQSIPIMSDLSHDHPGRQPCTGCGYHKDDTTYRHLGFEQGYAWLCDTCWTKSLPPHTPTPYHVEPEEWSAGHALAICCHDGIVAIIDPDPAPTLEDHANAEFICRACNSHDALVTACQNLLACLENWVEIAEPHDRRDYDTEAITHAKAALAIAQVQLKGKS